MVFPAYARNGAPVVRENRSTCPAAMPELPDITIYIESLKRHVLGERVQSIRVRSPFVVRSVEPPVAALEGRRATAFRRLGKRIVIAFEDDLFLVLHLMIAGRLRLRPAGDVAIGRTVLAAFDFADSTLLLTEAGTKKRASIHVVRGEGELKEHDPGGIEPLECSEDDLRETLQRENRTLKRALTSPHLLAGIGNAYSDEILHAAKLSPLQLTGKLNDDEIARLFNAMRDTLTVWIERLREEVGDGFPEKVTAFHKKMAVHGRFGKPCPACGTKVERIVRAENELNYCPGCQTGGKILRDRSLSLLLKDDWPGRVEE